MVQTAIMFPFVYNTCRKKIIWSSERTAIGPTLMITNNLNYEQGKYIFMVAETTTAW